MCFAFYYSSSEDGILSNSTKECTEMKLNTNTINVMQE